MNHPSSVVQSAIKKIVDTFTPALQHHMDSLSLCEFVENASNELVEHVYHLGEVALHRCFLYRSPPAERSCGSFKIIVQQVLSGTVLALLATKSDLEADGLSERSEAEIIRVLFGVLSLRLDERQLQRSFNELFDPILEAAQVAYVGYYKEKKTSSDAAHRRRIRADVRSSFSHLRSNPPATAQLTLGPVRKAASDVSEFASREVRTFMEIARKLPAAFMAGFRSGLFPTDPVNVTAEAARNGSPSPRPRRSLLVTPPRPKSYLRASAPSPPSLERRPHCASRLLSVPPRHVTFSQDDAGPELSGLPPISRRRIYFTLSSLPAFSLSGPNRSLIFNAQPYSRS
ncbi:hypothetical protein MSAN_00400000 [Mycena sanguinolenta]|uniref:Uncharacterized protein n=1 Tax=Mycena sanguinolenta TaxID=230812 RepID=A0A8H6ZDZ5_9AGAR|nr:hypothetical protein MSAN_00400000 [Mycena sanguinolenta]